MPQFVIQFQNLRLQISRPIPEDELKDIFLEALREPLRTTLGLFDFRNQSLEQVIDKALAMDRTQSNSINMSANYTEIYQHWKSSDFGKRFSVQLALTQDNRQWNAVCAPIAPYVILKVIRPNNVNIGIYQIIEPKRMINTRKYFTLIGEITIDEMITIMAEMNIGKMTGTSQDGMNINRTTIVMMIGVLMIGIIRRK